MADIIVQPPDSGDSIRVNMTGFDVSNTAYTFTVVANTLNGPGETSSSVTSRKLLCPSYSGLAGHKDGGGMNAGANRGGGVQEAPPFLSSIFVQKVLMHCILCS